jgi:hypothetical protein
MTPFADRSDAVRQGTCAGFTVGGLLTGLAAGAVIVVFVLPSVGSRLQGRAQEALAAVRKVEGTLVAAVDELGRPMPVRRMAPALAGSPVDEPNPVDEVVGLAVTVPSDDWPPPLPRYSPDPTPWPYAPPFWFRPLPLDRPWRRDGFPPRWRHPRIH